MGVIVMMMVTTVHGIYSSKLLMAESECVCTGVYALDIWLKMKESIVKLDKCHQEIDKQDCRFRTGVTGNGTEWRGSCKRYGIGVVGFGRDHDGL